MVSRFGGAVPGAEQMPSHPQNPPPWRIEPLQPYRTDGNSHLGVGGAVFQAGINIAGHAVPSAKQVNGLRETSTRWFLGAKRGRRVTLTNLTATCEPTLWKMWDPRLLTILWASMACYRDSFTFLCVVFIVSNASFIVCVALTALFCLSVV
jgi:hypothetical protein